MAHLACINLPLLPLQLLQRQEPALRERAAAVVESGRAQALVLQVNAHAWRRGVRPGLRQAAALALVGDLQTRTVPQDAVRATVTQLTHLLRKFTAHVEPSGVGLPEAPAGSADEPGLFWLSARGLRRLYGHPQAWSEAVHRALTEQGWQAVVVAGFGHFTTQVVARGASPSPAVEGGDRGGAAVVVFSTLAEEREAAARVPLSRCGLGGDELEALTQLGLRRLGDLLRLPAAGLLRRFGPRLYRLHRLATGTLQDPLQPQAERPAVRDWIFLEPPEDDTGRLLFRIEARLPFLLAPLAARREGLHILRLHLTLDNHARERLEVRPAQPTRQERLILELVRLRLERPPPSSPPTPLLPPQRARRKERGEQQPGWLSAGVTEILLEAEGRPRELEQANLLPSGSRRDLSAANRALAQLRAEFGEQAVVHAVPREAHLPEARFAWEPLQVLKQVSLAPVRPAAPAPALASPSPHAPEAGRRRQQPAPEAGRRRQQEGGRGEAGGGEQGPGPVRRPALVRRLLAKPVPLPGWPRDAAKWTQGRSPDADGLLALHGPYVISGGWWNHEQERDYYFAETAHGEVQWLYHDRRRGRWFCQGWVE